MNEFKSQKKSLSIGLMLYFMNRAFKEMTVRQIEELSSDIAAVAKKREQKARKKARAKAKQKLSDETAEFFDDYESVRVV